ncbi:MAG: NAD-dependent epimerase/dehydratase family protein [Gemmobacter sp.]
MPDSPAETLLVPGAAGRLGGFLRAAWADTPPGFRPVWQSRRPVPGWSRWDPDTTPMLPAAAVLVLAGVTAGTGAELARNTDIALAACRAAEAAGARQVFLASSAAVYGPTGNPVAETGPVNPVRPYGAAKLAMERAALGWARGRAIRVTALRIGNVAGADMLAGAAARGDVALDTFPDAPRGPVRSYIGPGGLARVIATLVEQALNGGDLPDILNLAAPAPVAMADLLDAAGIRFTPRPAPPEAIARVVMDTAALARLVPPRPGDSLPATMVAEWRALSGRQP